MTAATHGLALLACTLGFAALALAMHRHQHDLLGRALPTGQIRALRLLGTGALLGALWLVVAAQGWSLGLVSYSGHTSLGAGLVILALVAHDRWTTARRQAGTRGASARTRG